MKRLDKSQMLNVEGGCRYCMPLSGAVPRPPGFRVISYLTHILFH